MSVLDREITLYGSDFYYPLRPGVTNVVNVVGLLTDVLVCEVTEERNGIYELYAEYPLAGKYSGAIEVGMVITAPIAYGSTSHGTAMTQPFRIYKLSQTLDGTISIFAEHISYQLNSIPVKPFAQGAAEQTITGAMNNITANTIQPNPFNLSTTKTTAGTYTVTQPSPFRSLLMGQEGSLLDVFGGGEYLFDWYDVILYESRGADRGLRFVYGKNITDIAKEQDVSNLFTGVCPFWTNGEIIVTLPEGAVWSAYADAFPYQRTVVVDFSGDFETKPTVAQLRAKATAYLNANGASIIPESIDVEILPLLSERDNIAVTGFPPCVAVDAHGAITGYFNPPRQWARAELCDTVTVEYPALGINVTAKIVRTVWNCLLGQYKELTIGSIHYGLSDTLADMAQSVEDAQQGVALSQLYVGGLPMVLANETITKRFFCPSYVTNSSKRLAMNFPLSRPLASGATVTCTDLSIAVFLPAGGCPYALAGSTYTQLGSNFVTVWENGESKRSGEVTGITCENYGESIRVNVSFANTLRVNAGSTVVTNFSTPTVVAEATFTITPAT